MRFFLFFLSIFCFSLYSNEDKIYVAPHGVKTLEWVFELINVSEQSIEITNTFLGGDTGLQIIEAIEKRMKKCSLRVHLIAHPIYVSAQMKAVLHRLTITYPDRFFFLYSNEIPSNNQDITAINNHVKLMVFDEKYFIAGGTNFFDQGCTKGLDTPEKEPPRSLVHVCGASRDTDVVGRGEVAGELRHTFFYLYALWENYHNTKMLEMTLDHFKKSSRYFPILDQLPIAELPLLEESEDSVDAESIQMKFSGPLDIPNKISDEYTRLVSNAKSSISIGNLYFHPHDELMNAFLAAVNRGVKMSLITNGKYDGITPKVTKFFVWANRMSYTPLFYGRHFHLWESKETFNSPEKQTRIYEYCVKNTMYHKKTMVIDDRYFVVGSFNLGLKSRIGDFELILIIDSPEASKKMLEIFEIDKQHSREISLPQANSWYFDPWTAYLGGMQKKVSGLI